MVLTYIKLKRNSAEPTKTRFDQGICRDLSALFCYATIILENDNTKGTPIQEQQSLREGVRMRECIILSLYFKSN